MKITKDFKFAFADPNAPEIPGEGKVNKSIIIILYMNIKINLLFYKINFRW